MSISKGTEPIIEILQDPFPHSNLLCFFENLNPSQYQIPNNLNEFNSCNFCEIFLNQNNILCIRQGNNKNSSFLNDYLSLKATQLKLHKQIDLNTLHKEIYEDVFITHNIYGYLEMKTNKTVCTNNTYLSHITRKIDMIKSSLLCHSPINRYEYENYFIHHNVKIELNDGYIDLVNDTISDLLTEMTMIHTKEINEDKINKTLNDIIKHIDNMHLLNYLEYFYSLFIYRETLNDDPYKHINKTTINQIVLKYLLNKTLSNHEAIKTKPQIPPLLITSEDNDTDNKLYNEIKTELNQLEKEYETEISRNIPFNKITHLYINTLQMKKETINNILTLLTINTNKTRKRNQSQNNKLFNIIFLAWIFDEQETQHTFHIQNAIKIASIPFQHSLHNTIHIYYLYNKK